MSDIFGQIGAKLGQEFNRIGNYEDFAAGLGSVVAPPPPTGTISAEVVTSDIIATSPNLPTGQVKLYYASDTKDLYVYDGNYTQFEDNT